MDVEFSAKLNDKKAQAVAQRISEKLEAANITGDYLSPVCAFLSEYANLAYSESMAILTSLGFSGTPTDILRLSYALIHYTKQSGYGVTTKVVAHAKIVQVTADRMDSANPRICLRLLLVSSCYAGRYLDYEVSIRDAVKIQKQIYSGRSRALSGRSLLELTGALCQAGILGDMVQYVTATKEEKQINKQLCTSRAKADTCCAKASSCVCCKERRSTCRLAVRY